MSKIFNGSKPSIVLIFIVQFLALRFTPVEGMNENELARISLRVYAGETTSNKYYDVPIGETRNLALKLDAAKPTVLYLHGFQENLERESVRTIVGAYLKRGDHNVIAVNYAEIANGTYIQAVESAEAVGKKLAIALRQLIAGVLDPKLIHIVGYSLGAQVAAYINKYAVVFKVQRLTALDPIGPAFLAVAKRITSADAKFVDVIHTDAFIYGNGYASGGADFWPNSGLRVQPGCPLQYEKGSEEDFCSHQRSWQYYAESVENPKAFMAAKSVTWTKFLGSAHKKQDLVPMGLATPSGTTGLFYLKTNQQSPFGMEENGVKLADLFNVVQTDGARILQK
ncbi:phospholipase A1 member A-like isoform X1 [Neodiprion fabricii]|uniref:phospholipase A1 member A-like isoform X1 n=2 Tax=Neodiprion fabricii TaxID=2872261 RepID=UPI001ED95EAC|nr:phospholipase A1 member A-like isoform X1 [Neodiprion fabricii]